MAAALLAILILGPAPLLLHLEPNNSPEVYLPSSAPAVKLDRELRTRFPEDKLLIAVFDGDDLYTRSFLEPFGRLSTDIERHPLVERAFSVVTAERISGTADGFNVELLLDPDDLDRYNPDERRKRVTTDRFAPGFLTATDGSVLALAVRPHQLENSRQRLELEQFLRARVTESGLDGHLAAVAGDVALDVAQLRSMVRDSIVFIPSTMLIGLLILWWLFRRPLALGLTIVTMTAAIVPSLSLFVAIGWPYTLISSMAPALLVALTVAFLMHFFNALRRADQRGFNGPSRVDRALEDTARPTIFTALTTAAGLTSLAASPIEPIRVFGLISAAGVLIICFVVLVLLPPLVRWSDCGTWRSPTRGLVWIRRTVSRAARLAIRHAGIVIVIMIAVLMLNTPWVTRIVVETDLYAFFSENHPISISTRKVEDELSGVTALEVIYDGGGRDTLLEPSHLRTVRSLQDWLDERPEIDRTFSMVELIEEMHWAFNEERDEYRTLPDDKPLISQYLLVYDGNDLYDVVDRDFQRGRILLNLNVHGARDIQEVMQDIRGFIDDRSRNNLQWELAGMGRLFADQESLLVQGQLRSMILVLTFIFIMMLMMWRSVGSAVLCMLPNMAPILFIFILMGVLGIWLDMATAMIASVAVGIAVDDTIHIYHGYRQRRLNGARTVTALIRTYNQAGHAIVATTMVLCAQFLLLTSSAFEPTVAFGLLTAVGLAAALAFDLLLLPAILVTAARWKGDSAPPYRQA